MFALPMFTLLPKGWRLFGVVALVVALPSMALVLAEGASVEALRSGLRYTARTSAVVFLLAFTASAAARLLPHAFTRWQRANRRFLGLGFAFSHLVHGGFIVAFAAQGPEHYAEALTPGMVVAGSIGYTLIILMAATSFRRTAAMLGPRVWRQLHTVGIHWLWLQFVIAFGKRAVGGGALYWGFIGVFVAALVLRVVAARLRPPARVQDAA